MEMASDKSIYIISDLHIGNGSYLDQFRRARAEPLLLKFLDFVASQQGQLMILGDLMELWRFPVGQVVDHRGRLLDRLSQANPIYIPGNHDIKLTQMDGQTLHPFLSRIQDPLTTEIGDKRFRFMHGHEIDPLISDRVYSKTIPRYMIPAFALKDNICRATGGKLSELFLEGTEYYFRLMHNLRGHPTGRIHPELIEARKRIEQPHKPSIHAYGMLSRYLHDKDKNDYDVTIVGHSHKVGRYGNWYFNSGCWIQARHSFLKIWPDGHVEVFDWDEQGAHPNQAVVGSRRLKLN